MRELLKKYQEQVLIIVAVFILAGIVWIFIWGMNILIANLNKALNVGTAPSAPTEFNLKEAENLLQPRGAIP